MSVDVGRVQVEHWDWDKAWVEVGVGVGVSVWVLGVGVRDWVLGVYAAQQNSMYCHLPADASNRQR